jgi:hypothetical protein
MASVPILISPHERQERDERAGLADHNMVVADYDLGIQLSAATPAPLKKYFLSKLDASGVKVFTPSQDSAATTRSEEEILLVTLPQALLEECAEQCAMQKHLAQHCAPRAHSETLWPVRTFRRRDRASFIEGSGSGIVVFTASERSYLAHDFLENALATDDLWSAALVASGRADAASSPNPAWFVGPGDGWVGQPLLGALRNLGYLLVAAPTHTTARRASTGLPPANVSAIGAHLAAFLLSGGRKSLVDIRSIRDYHGERVAFYFAWASFYLTMLAVPACGGLAVWLARPVGVSVDDDPLVPLFSLVAVAWAILFVQAWRRRQSELSFEWGTSDDARSASAPPGREALRPSFVGQPATDPVSGRSILVDAPLERLRRYALSVSASILSLSVPLAAMICSLNLQGYISPTTGAWYGVRVYFEPLARHALPGEIFDPAGSLALAPVALHAVTIMLLNSGWRGIAHRLAAFENHRTVASYEMSVLLKRFAFEACDCYLALFYIALELQDVPKLRAELVALLTADTVRRVVLETLLPLVLNYQAVRTSAAATAARGTARDAGDTQVTSSAISAELALEEYESFDDYVEMVIQFGYIVLFASAMPLASAICFVGNAIELLADSLKLTFLCRRPCPARDKSIGGWSICCYVIMVVSIYTNLFLVAASSDQLAAIFPSLFTDSLDAADGGHGRRGRWGISGRGGKKHPSAMPTHNEHAMKAGAGRYVVLLCVAVEHTMLLFLLLTEVFIARATPGWIRLTLARRDFEERNKGEMAAMSSGGSGGGGGGATPAPTTAVRTPLESKNVAATGAASTGAAAEAGAAKLPDGPPGFMSPDIKSPDIFMH